MTGPPYPLSPATGDGASAKAEAQECSSSSSIGGGDPTGVSAAAASERAADARSAWGCVDGEAGRMCAGGEELGSSKSNSSAGQDGSNAVRSRSRHSSSCNPAADLRTSGSGRSCSSGGEDDEPAENGCSVEKRHAMCQQDEPRQQEQQEQQPQLSVAPETGEDEPEEVGWNYMFRKLLGMNYKDAGTVTYGDKQTPLHARAGSAGLPTTVPCAAAAAAAAAALQHSPMFRASAAGALSPLAAAAAFQEPARVAAGAGAAGAGAAAAGTGERTVKEGGRGSFSGLPAAAGVPFSSPAQLSHYRAPASSPLVAGGGGQQQQQHPSPLLAPALQTLTPQRAAPVAAAAAAAAAAAGTALQQYDEARPVGYVRLIPSKDLCVAGSVCDESVEAVRLLAHTLQLRKLWTCSFPSFPSVAIRPPAPEERETERSNEPIYRPLEVPLQAPCNASFYMLDGVYQVLWDPAVDKRPSASYTPPPLWGEKKRAPTVKEFLRALKDVMTAVQNPACKSFCYKRLKYLEQKFSLHLMFNALAEASETRNNYHRDFYNVRKVDTHVHHSACMQQKHLLRFIRKKYRTEGDTVVAVQRDGSKQTLRDIFQREVGIDAYNASIDHLDVHALGSCFQRFDLFNQKYNPFGQRLLREVFLKTDNYLRGRFLAEITREVISDLEERRYQHAEWRLSVYGRSRAEWKNLACWVVENKLFSRRVRWMVQVPRLYHVYRRLGVIKNFGELLTNVFEPLFEAVRSPDQHPEIYIFLTMLVGWDSVDDESYASKYTMEGGELPRPEDWTSENNPPYSYWAFYMYANIRALNHFMVARGMHALAFRPHCGEAGSVSHLASMFLLADAINHGIMLKKSPVLQYLYYLAQVGLALSPLSNNALFMNIAKNPLYSFFKVGLNVSISTDDPLMFHFTDEPLLEEYSVAAHTWKLSPVDLCELARNSILQSGYEDEFKRHWLGADYKLGGRRGNCMRQTNVSNIRLQYREDALREEFNYMHDVLALRIAISMPLPLLSASAQSSPVQAQGSSSSSSTTNTVGAGIPAAAAALYGAPAFTAGSRTLSPAGAPAMDATSVCPAAAFALPVHAAAAAPAAALSAPPVYPWAAPPTLPTSPVTAAAAAPAAGLAREATQLQREAGLPEKQQLQEQQQPTGAPVKEQELLRKNGPLPSATAALHSPEAATEGSNASAAKDEWPAAPAAAGVEAAAGARAAGLPFAIVLTAGEGEDASRTLHPGLAGAAAAGRNDQERDDAAHAATFKMPSAGAGLPPAPPAAVHDLIGLNPVEAAVGNLSAAVAAGLVVAQGVAAAAAASGEELAAAAGGKEITSAKEAANKFLEVAEESGSIELLRLKKLDGGIGRHSSADLCAMDGPTREALQTLESTAHLQTAAFSSSSSCSSSSTKTPPGSCGLHSNTRSPRRSSSSGLPRDDIGDKRRSSSASSSSSSRVLGESGGSSREVNGEEEEEEEEETLGHSTGSRSETLSSSCSSGHGTPFAGGDSPGSHTRKKDSPFLSSGESPSAPSGKSSSASSAAVSSNNAAAVPPAASAAPSRTSKTAAAAAAAMAAHFPPAAAATPAHTSSTRAARTPAPREGLAAGAAPVSPAPSQARAAGAATTPARVVDRVASERLAEQEDIAATGYPTAAAVAAAAARRCWGGEQLFEGGQPVNAEEDTDGNTGRDEEDTEAETASLAAVAEETQQEGFLENAEGPLRQLLFAEELASAEDSGSQPSITSPSPAPHRRMPSS